jgi:hypothetical protein
MIYFTAEQIEDGTTSYCGIDYVNETLAREISMPTRVERRDGKFRVVDPDGSVTTNNAGTSVDGGGHATRQEAEAQSRAINSHDGKKEKR